MAKYVIKARQFKRDEMKFDTYTITSEDAKHKFSLGINDVDKSKIKAPCAIAVEIDTNKLSASKKLSANTGEYINKLYVNMNDIHILEDQSLVAKLNANEVNKLFN